jgi:diphthamide biosynthesis protein 3
VRLHTHATFFDLSFDSTKIFLFRRKAPQLNIVRMSYYDEIEIEDMTFDSTLQIYHYPCPCGDRFEICISDLRDGEDVAVCPSCSLMIKVIFDAVWHSLLQNLESNC